MPEAKNRCLMRDPIADQINAGETPHVGRLNQRIFLGWITEAVLLLHHVNPEHCGHGI